MRTPRVVYHTDAPLTEMQELGQNRDFRWENPLDSMEPEELEEYHDYLTSSSGGEEEYLP